MPSWGPPALAAASDIPSSKIQHGPPRFSHHGRSLGGAGQGEKRGKVKMSKRHHFRFADTANNAYDQLDTFVFDDESANYV